MTKDFNEALKLVEEFVSDDDLEKSEIDGQQLKEAMKTLLAFKSDLYAELKNAISVILRWATNKKYGDTTKKSRVRVDDWPSVPIAAPAFICEKMIDRLDGKDTKDDEGADE